MGWDLEKRSCVCYYRVIGINIITLAHPDTDEFLLWLDSPAGAVAKVLSRRNIGLILDEYLEFRCKLD